MTLRDVAVNKKAKDLPDDGHVSDGRLAGVLKIKRLLLEMIAEKQTARTGLLCRSVGVAIQSTRPGLP